MGILSRFKRFDKTPIVRKIGQYPQLDLRIVRDHELSAVRCRKQRRIPLRAGIAARFGFEHEKRPVGAPIWRKSAWIRPVLGSINSEMFSPKLADGLGHAAIFEQLCDDRIFFRQRLQFRRARRVRHRTRRIDESVGHLRLRIEIDLGPPKQRRLGDTGGEHILQLSCRGL